jgi:hypothetical protein
VTKRRCVAVKLLHVDFATLRIREYGILLQGQGLRLEKRCRCLLNNNLKFQVFDKNPSNEPLPQARIIFTEIVRIYEKIKRRPQGSL